MTQTEIDVRTADGVMNVHLHAPPKPGRAPAVIMIPDAFGVRPAMDEAAERLAGHGYFVAVPEVLYRAGKFAPFDPKTVFSGDTAERDRLMAIMKKADGASVMRDLRALLDELAKNPAAGTDRVGCVGYCMGGRLAFMAAAAHPLQVAAVGCFHGGNLATDEPDSPHLAASKIRARLYFGVADNDRSCTPESQQKLRAALDHAHVKYELEPYPGALHGFAVTDTPVFDADAHAKHWERMLALLDEALH